MDNDASTIDDQAQAQEGQPRERTFTQADIDAAISERLKDERKKHAEEMSRFSDYDELKAKADRLDEIDQANKTELEKATEAASAATARAEEAEARLAAMEAKSAHDALVARVAEEEGVPSSLLKGDDEDSLRESAKGLKAWQDSAKPKVPDLKAGGATPAPDDERKLSEREEYAFRAR